MLEACGTGTGTEASRARASAGEPLRVTAHDLMVDGISRIVASMLAKGGCGWLLGGELGGSNNE